MRRWTITAAAVALVLAGCSSTHDDTKTCADACAAVFACAQHFGYDLTNTVGTRAECVTACESRACSAADGGRVTACIATATCGPTVDAWSASVLACKSGSCAASLPLPVGACDTIASEGTCAEQLGTDAADTAYGKGHCENVTHGTWVPSCQAASRIAECLYLVEGTGGRTVFYASYAGSLATAKTGCDGIPYPHWWTVY